MQTRHTLGADLTQGTNIGDARFKQSARIPGLMSRLLQLTHPDFSLMSLSDISEGLNKETQTSLEPTLYEPE